MQKTEFCVNVTGRYDNDSYKTLTQDFWKHIKNPFTAKYPITPEVFLGEDEIWDCYLRSWGVRNVLSYTNRYITMKVEELEYTVHVNDTAGMSRWDSSVQRSRGSFSNPAEVHQGFRLLPEFYPIEHNNLSTTFYPINVAGQNYRAPLYMGIIKPGTTRLQTLTLVLQQCNGNMPFNPVSLSQYPSGGYHTIHFEFLFKKRVKEDPGQSIVSSYPSRRFMIFDHWLHYENIGRLVGYPGLFKERITLSPNVKINGPTDVYLEYVNILGFNSIAQRIIRFFFDEIETSAVGNLTTGDNVQFGGGLGFAAAAGDIGSGSWYIPVFPNRYFHAGRYGRGGANQFYPNPQRLGLLRQTSGTLSHLNFNLGNYINAAAFMSVPSHLKNQGNSGLEITFVMTLVDLK
jgi:hypothetical protein